VNESSRIERKDYPAMGIDSWAAYRAVTADKRWKLPQPYASLNYDFIVQF